MKDTIIYTNDSRSIQNHMAESAVQTDMFSKMYGDNGMCKNCFT